MKFIHCKKGEEILISNLIYLLVVIAFFAMLFYFVFSYSNGAGIYEEAYAKKLALALDNSLPGMYFVFDVKDVLEIADKNGVNRENVFSFDKENSRIEVSLQNNKFYGFYSYVDYDIEFKLRGTNLIVEVETSAEDSELDDLIGEGVISETDLEMLSLIMETDINCVCEENCRDYASLILKYSKDIDPYLVLAVMIQESNCRQEAENSGARGLMQITKTTFDDVCSSKLPGVSFEEIKKPENNIACGVEVLLNKYEVANVDNFNPSTCDKSYVDSLNDWQRAVRGYVGWNCDIHKNYVLEVYGRYNELKQKSKELNV